MLGLEISLEKWANDLGNKLASLRLKLTTAESCTGGGLSYWITSIPGSSAWFERGFVTYTNAAKVEMLGIKPITLESFGAVSEPTAREMAEGALSKSHADISIAITGIAGPDGESLQKPVGTVWMACAKRHEQTRTEVHLFSGDRETIRQHAIKRALAYVMEVF